MVSVKVTLAPKASIVSTRSRVEFAGIANSISMSYKRAIIASAMPVLPEVASMSFIPAFNSPRAMAPSIMFFAARSFTEPPGLLPSSFPKILTFGFGFKRDNSTKGVFPTKSNSWLILILNDFDGFLVVYLGVSRNAAR